MFLNLIRGDIYSNKDRKQKEVSSSTFSFNINGDDNSYPSLFIKLHWREESCG